jgi:hypothetical protein
LCKKNNFQEDNALLLFTAGSGCKYVVKEQKKKKQKKKKEKRMKQQTNEWVTKRRYIKLKGSGNARRNNMNELLGWLELHTYVHYLFVHVVHFTLRLHTYSVEFRNNVT